MYIILPSLQPALKAATRARVRARVTSCAAVALMHCLTDFTISVLALAWAARHIGPSNDVTSLRMDTDPATDGGSMAINHAKQWVMC